MPRVVVKVAGAPNRTRWTLSQHESTGAVTCSPKLVNGDDPFAEKEREAEQEQEQEEAERRTMQANGHYYRPSLDHEAPLPRYESFDGSQYSVQPSLGRQSDVMNGGYPHDEFMYNTPLEERASHQLGMDNHLGSQNHDAVGHHLLYETAMLDTQAYEILDIAKVDELKKEYMRLDARLEAANRKLALESKVKDAAQNLQRLYSINSKNRPDTPQSPDSQKKGRNSLLANRNRTSSGSGGGTLHQAEGELATSIKKVDELNEQIKNLLDRRQLVERTLLRHTAAVLAEQASRTSQKIPGTALSNGNHVVEPPEEQDAASSSYSPDEFDGIRDILHGGRISGVNLGKGGNVRKMQEAHEQQMASVQNRLEQLNDQLRHIIGEASRTRGKDLEPELDLHDEDDDDATLRLDKRFSKLESNLRTLEREQEDVKAHYAQIEHSAYTTSNAVEEQLATLNHQIHNTLLLGSDMSDMQTLRDVPQATGNGYQPQLQYLQESLGNMEELLKQQRAELDMAREASRALDDSNSKAKSHSQRLGEYEATLGGLWDILQSDAPSRRPSMMADREVDDEYGLPSPSTPLKEDFSLQAFSARVQHLFDRSQSAKEQQDILRRQIQQQRELNGKSDAEKDRQLAELQTRHDRLAQEHGTAQEELTRIMALHAQAESESSEAKLELMNVMNEFEALKRLIDAKQQEREDMARQLQEHQAHAASLQEQVEGLEAQVSELDEMTEQVQSVHAAREQAEQKHKDVQNEMQGLESEVVRLTTELTMAKAELEGAYGSRAERAKEAQAAEVAGLTEQNALMKEQLQQLQREHEGTLAQMEELRKQAGASDRIKVLEAELEAMAREFQELTREAVVLEKERGQLEELIDGLRERCEALEAQLGDEKVRWLGVRSPGGAGGEVGGGGLGREMTSMTVLRQEFKKMMREARAEGVKLLRVSLSCLSLPKAYLLHGSIWTFMADKLF
jgi:hypothetical protein